MSPRCNLTCLRCSIITYPLAGILGATLGLAPMALVLAGIALTAGIIATRSWGSKPTTAPHITHVESSTSR